MVLIIIALIRGINGAYSSNNEIYFRKVKPDIPGIKSISVLLKHPEITVLKDERSHSKNEQVDVGKIAVSFQRRFAQKRSN